jgi:hypothetical protein
MMGGSVRAEVWEGQVKTRTEIADECLRQRLQRVGRLFLIERVMFHWEAERSLRNVRSESPLTRLAAVFPELRSDLEIACPVNYYSSMRRHHGEEATWFQ